jgi:hypothetical protein
VGEEVSDSNGLRRRPKSIRASRDIERFEYLQVGELRQMFFDRIVKGKATLLN